MTNCPLREEKSFSQRAFLIFTNRKIENINIENQQNIIYNLSDKKYNSERKIL